MRCRRAWLAWAGQGEDDGEHQNISLVTRLIVDKPALVQSEITQSGESSPLSSRIHLRKGGDGVEAIEENLALAAVSEASARMASFVQRIDVTAGVVSGGVVSGHAAQPVHGPRSGRPAGFRRPRAGACHWRVLDE